MKSLGEEIEMFEAARQNILDHINDPFHESLRAQSLELAVFALGKYIEEDKCHKKYYEEKVAPFLGDPYEIRS